jgi:hypothetical protein
MSIRTLSVTRPEFERIYKAFLGEMESKFL